MRTAFITLAAPPSRAAPLPLLSRATRRSRKSPDEWPDRLNGASRRPRARVFRPSTATRLLYRNGSKLWVNQLQDGCGGFGRWDVLVTEPIGTQYCRGDLIRSFDPVSKIPGPSCRLGDFVPYTRG